MNTDKRLWPAFPLVLAVLMLGIGGPAWASVSPAWGNHHDDDEIPFAEAHLFFELNNTDGDLGIHALIDGDAWRKLEIEDVREREILDVTVKGRLRRQGLTEIFFESAEPRFESDDPDEVTLTPEQFFRRFPAGEYEIEGKTLEGGELESEVELTHLMPAPPVPSVNGEPVAQVCDEEDPDFDAPEVTAPVTIEWADVMTSHPDLGSPRNSGDIVIHNYEVVVEVEFEVNGEEFASVMSVILPPGETSMTIPEQFIGLGEEFKYEVLAREESFNQTATESCFLLAGE